MKNVIVIGMGMSSRDLTAAHMEIIRSADLLMGGRRHLAQFPDLAMEKQAITGNVAEVIETIRARKPQRRIVVLASGDPLLFGIGARICREIGADNITVLPNVSSIAAAFARIHLAWDDAKIISLHGRNRKYHLLEALHAREPVALLTDREQSPDWVAGWLLQKGVEDVRMAVFEQLGTVEEIFGWHSLQQAAARHFAYPNVVIFQSQPANNSGEGKCRFGMPDDAFAHERGLITKAEVRAVTLAKLRLKPDLTLWDLGAGSGAVGMEASTLIGPGRVIAVEEKSERVALIRENARRLCVYNYEVIQAKLPAGLDDLPQPERIFIGGGGRDLAAIITRACLKLQPEGVVVANTVLVDNLAGAINAMEAAGLTTEVVQMQISRSKGMPWSRRFEAENPVWIVTGSR